MAKKNKDKTTINPIEGKELEAIKLAHKQAQDVKKKKNKDKDKK